MADTDKPIVVLCLPRLGDVLAHELMLCGYVPGFSDDKSAIVKGNFADVFRLNLMLRTASRVLWPVASFPASNPNELYRGALGIPWENKMRSDGYFSIDSFVRNDAIRDTRFSNVKFKDAVADRFMKTHGRRPNSGPEKTGVVIYFRWIDNHCDVYFDSSGETLAKHGYRIRSVRAPLIESLAAALVYQSGWKGEGHFLNPMCGSGTLAIEAALIRSGMYPALKRRNFAFQQLKGFNPTQWNDLCDHLERKKVKASANWGRIIASDRDPAAVEAARINACAAGVEELIEFSVCDFAASPVPEGGGLVLMNPEYGERMGDAASLEPVYASIGDFFKQRCSGYRGYVFTGNMDLAKKIGLHARSRIPFFNARIDCRLIEYELYQGSRRSAQGHSPSGISP